MFDKAKRNQEQALKDRAKAKKVLRELAGKQRGRAAMSGLKKAPTQSDDERFRAKRAIDYKRKFNKGGY